jgi:hypothetical protein
LLFTNEIDQAVDSLSNETQRYFGMNRLFVSFKYKQKYDIVIGVRLPLPLVSERRIKNEKD